MKKVSTSATKRSSDFSQPKLTIGLDLGDRSSWYCVLDERGELQGDGIRTCEFALCRACSSEFSNPDAGPAWAGMLYRSSQ